MENKTEILQHVLKKCSKFPCAWFYKINFRDVFLRAFAYANAGRLKV